MNFDNDVIDSWRWNPLYKFSNLLVNLSIEFSSEKQICVY